MVLIDCGKGPFVVLEEVVCENCGPRLWNSFDEFPEIHHEFPLIVRTEFVREQGRCNCGGQVRCATTPISNQDIPYVGYYDVGPFPDGESIRVFEVDPSWQVQG